MVSADRAVHPKARVQGALAQARRGTEHSEVLMNIVPAGLQGGDPNKQGF